MTLQRMLSKFMQFKIKSNMNNNRLNIHHSNFMFNILKKIRNKF